MTTLNNRYDGPHAYSDAEQVALWNNTQWLLEYAQDYVETHGGAWSDWPNAETLRTTYEDDRSGEPSGEYVEVGARGLVILQAAIDGQDHEALMDQWQNDIQGAGANITPEDALQAGWDWYNSPSTSKADMIDFCATRGVDLVGTDGALIEDWAQVAASTYAKAQQEAGA